MIKRIKNYEIIKWNAPNLKNKNFADRDLISVVDCREENLEEIEKEVESFLKYPK
jgi:hypothetical protein